MKLVTTIIAAYFMAFVLTYGHAYHSPGVQTTSIAGRVDPVSRAFGAFFAAAFWPLYWSIDIMEPASHSSKGDAA